MGFKKNNITIITAYHHPSFTKTKMQNKFILQLLTLIYNFIMLLFLENLMKLDFQAKENKQEWK